MNPVAVEAVMVVLGIALAVACKPLAALNIAFRRSIWRQRELDDDDERFVMWSFVVFGLVIAGAGIYLLAV